jgi:hypothetical protein
MPAPTRTRQAVRPPTPGRTAFFDPKIKIL